MGNDTLTVLPDTRTRLQKYAKELNEYIELHYKDIGPSPSGGYGGDGQNEADDPQAKERNLVYEARDLIGKASKWTGPVDGEQDELGADTTGGTGEAPDDNDDV